DVMLQPAPGEEARPEAIGEEEKVILPKRRKSIRETVELKTPDEWTIGQPTEVQESVEEEAATVILKPKKKPSLVPEEPITAELEVKKPEETKEEEEVEETAFKIKPKKRKPSLVPEEPVTAELEVKKPEEIVEEVEETAFKLKPKKKS